MTPLRLSIPELALVVLIGTSGSGKSTFARRHFLPTEVLSSDACRGWVSDDENNQSVSREAFEVLHFIAAKRLAAGRLTVVDATNVQPEGRRQLIDLAKRFHVFGVAIVLNVPEALARERNLQRPDRNFGDHVIRNQARELRFSLPRLEREGFRFVHVLKDPADIDRVVIERTPLWSNRTGETGPFDIIGDVHGCYDELVALLERLGYALLTEEGALGPVARHPEGRRLVFVGDLVDRGPATPAVLRLVMASVAAGTALCVAGNHDAKLGRVLGGKQAKLTHGLAESVEQLAAESEDFRQAAREFLDGLVSHYQLDQGRLVVAHAGLKAELQGRTSGAVRSFAMYGETTGEIDEYGLPVRADWAAEYRGKAMVVYGHTPVVEAEWVNGTICVDTGCVFGGKLTALRYPERELVSVPAAQVYYASARPLAPQRGLSIQQGLDDRLDLADFTGRRHIDTRLKPAITIREVNSAAALEVISRFAVNPKWLVYLPPTMSPPETSTDPAWLEHPREALGYYADAGVESVVCEEKHMGSRAVVVLCASEAAARQRFGLMGAGRGVVYTRTGRRFFNDPALEAALLERLAGAMAASGLWNELRTEWVVLDCELLPWSAKAQDLLRSQYAAVGAAGRRALQDVSAVLVQAAGRGLPIEPLTGLMAGRQEAVDAYVAAYRRYCWPVQGLADLRLAPFHLLAAEGRVFADHDHLWHMQTLARLAAADPGLVIATAHREVDLANPASVDAAIDWWLQLTREGGEGMVVKPRSFIARGSNGYLQPAIKCRGREYLRIIYGPEYDRPEHLERLRSRRVGTKRRLAAQEFALGMEALERFVAREPLRRVHECVFGVLALESEPVDPRL